MRLNIKILYGVIALYDIAYHGDGGPSQIKDISERQNIPKRFLEQIFFKLKNEGLLLSKRGPNGGYYLPKPSSEITVMDIVRILDSGIKFFSNTNSRSKKKEGVFDGELVTTPIWQNIASVLSDQFSSITLADICESAEQLNVKKNIRHRYDYHI